MKSLLLMRHAKSSWKDEKLADIERPLTKRGRLAAPRMGALLRDKELVPQLILSSTAVRARQTAEFVASGAGFTGDVEYLNSLYLAEPAVCLGALSTLSDEFERVMVVGHNPGLEGLLQMLSRRIVALSAGAVAYLSLPLQSWKDLSAETEGELVELVALSEEEEEKIKQQIKEEKKADKGMKKTEKVDKKVAEREEKRVEKKGKKITDPKSAGDSTEK